MQEAAEQSAREGGAVVMRKAPANGKREPVTVRKEGDQIYLGYDKECAPCSPFFGLYAASPADTRAKAQPSGCGAATPSSALRQSVMKEHACHRALLLVAHRAFASAPGRAANPGTLTAAGMSSRGGRACRGATSRMTSTDTPQRKASGRSVRASPTPSFLWLVVSMHSCACPHAVGMAAAQARHVSTRKARGM